MSSVQIFMDYQLPILSRLGCNATWWLRKNNRFLFEQCLMAWKICNIL